MLSYYGKRPTECLSNDLHYFSRMRRGLKGRNVKVRRVSNKKIIVFKNEIIVRWKIVKDNDGRLYLGYITETFSYYAPTDFYSVYVVAPGLNPANPYIALHRIDHLLNDFFKD